MHVWDVDTNWPREAWHEGWSTLKQAGSISVDTVHRRKDGTLRHVEVTGNHFVVDGEEFLFAHATDITERKCTEERLRERESQLAHVSRLSTMGEMVAGIAHELNQPLYSIVNYSKATGNVIKSPTAESLAQIEAWNEQIGKAATRAGQIIRRLRGFVQRESTYLVTDLHETIRDALELVRHESERAGITLRVNRTPHDAEVRVDRVQIQQVLVNLLVNAIEAIAQHDGQIREIVVTTSRCDDGLQVAVADTGHGITRQEDRKMFAAFETTKKGGMGMGLAISSTIIETFGGRLWSGSNDRGGATFYFTLPTAESGVDDAS
jgi:two-component system sensor kinase FixL